MKQRYRPDSDGGDYVAYEDYEELEAALKRETNDYIEASCSLAIERDEVKDENKRLRKRIAELEAERDEWRRIAIDAKVG